MSERWGDSQRHRDELDAWITREPEGRPDETAEVGWDRIRRAYDRHRDNEIVVVLGEEAAEYGIFHLPEPDKHRRNRLIAIGQLYSIADELLRELLGEVDS